MCNVGAVALIGGGTLLNSIGQNQGLRAQQRTQAAALETIKAADRAIRDRAVESAARIAEGFAREGQIDTSATTAALSDLGVAGGGGAALTLARARQQARPLARSRQQQAARDELRGLSNFARSTAGDARLSLRSLPQEMQAAGMRGAELRAAGGTLSGFGQVMAAQVPDEAADEAAASTASAGPASVLRDERETVTPAQRLFGQPLTGAPGLSLSLRG